jgi:hypothetical protein
MIYLMQIMNMLNKKERTDLIHILEDLSFELEEMGWNSDPEGLISDILFNHFGFEMEDPKQLTWLTDWVLEKQNSPQSFKALLTTVNLQKGEA